MYFKDFPTFLYDFNYGTTENKTSIVVDITRNVRFRKELLSSITYFDEYDIMDGETPEIVAERIYGNAEYHWIVMLANDRTDYLTDFPVEHTTLLKHAATKYNPKLNSNAGDWYFTGTGSSRRLYFKVSNSAQAFNPAELTTSVPFTVSGATTTGSFSIPKVWGGSDSGIDFLTQHFWVQTSEGSTGTPTGNLTITTTGRENNPVYWVNSEGYKVNSDASGATSVSGLQEEERINESKRRIKIISPQLVNTILKNFKDSL
jgi:hypothetical protein